MKQDGFTVLFCGASARIAGSEHLRRPRRETPDYNETPVDGRALHVLKYIRHFYISPSTARTAFARVFHLQAAKQCTKPDRLNRRVAAPAASATVNVKTVTIRAFDGRTQHRLELLLRVISIRQYYDYPSTVRTSFARVFHLLRVISIRQFYDYPSTDRMSFARVFHRGTPGVRSLQAEKSPHESKTVGSGIGL